MRRYGRDEKEKEVINQINYLTKKKIGYADIADQLNARMIPSKTGRRWNYHLVRNISIGEAHQHD